MSQMEWFNLTIEKQIVESSVEINLSRRIPNDFFLVSGFLLSLNYCSLEIDVIFRPFSCLNLNCVKENNELVSSKTRVLKTTEEV